MSIRLAFVLLVVLALGCGQGVESDGLALPTAAKPSTSEVAGNAPNSRTFKFVYGAALTDLEPGTLVSVWLPVATNSHDQEVELISTNLPTKYQRTSDAKYGNEIIFFQAEANNEGEIPIEVTYRVTRRELTSDNYEPSENDATMYLASAALIPTDDTLRKQVLGAEPVHGAPIEVARRLYDAVESHMKYDKPSDRLGWGRGDAAWACSNGFGNCTDFHSLFISSSRNLRIPARFEIGFPLPKEPCHDNCKVGGYHCWAKFLADGQWVPVDISEADKHPELKEYYFGNLSQNRIAFSVGRDLELRPAPAAGPVNYLVYPYAEVNGKQHKSFRKAFRFADIE